MTYNPTREMEDMASVLTGRDCSSCNGQGSDAENMRCSKCAGTGEECLPVKEVTPEIRAEVLLDFLEYGKWVEEESESNRQRFIEAATIFFTTIDAIPAHRLLPALQAENARLRADIASRDITGISMIPSAAKLQARVNELEETNKRLSEELKKRLRRNEYISGDPQALRADEQPGEVK